MRRFRKKKRYEEGCRMQGKESSMRMHLLIKAKASSLVAEPLPPAVCSNAAMPTRAPHTALSALPPPCES